LETKNIFVSTGAPEIIEGAIRFSFYIIKTVEAIKDILPKIRIKRGGRR